MRKIIIKKNKMMQEDEISEVYEATVKPIGNGAMILSTKKLIGKNVYVVVKK